MGRFLAIDHGNKRVGLALSDPMKIIAKPFRTLTFTDASELLNSLRDIIESESVEQIILGLPGVTVDDNFISIPEYGYNYGDDNKLLEILSTAIKSKRSMSKDIRNDQYKINYSWFNKDAGFWWTVKDSNPQP